MTKLDSVEPGPAPAVRFEACAEFRPDPDCPWCACTTCGRLADEHAANRSSRGAVMVPAATLVEPVLRRAS